MAIFGFGKKKETACCNGEKKTSCACGGQCGNSGTNARILVLGACCKKSADTFANVTQAAAELGFSDTVQNIGDAVEIAQYGVMQTPALVVNGKVLSYGKLISVDEAKKLLQQAVQA